MLGGVVVTTGAAVRSGAAEGAANLFCELPVFGLDCAEGSNERTESDPGRLPRRADLEAGGGEAGTGKGVAIAGMIGIAPAGSATATSGGTAASAAGLAGVASFLLSGAAFIAAMVFPYPWNDMGAGERELADGVELRWDYAQLNSLTVVGPNGNVLLSAREAGDYFVAPDGLVVATKTDSGPELIPWAHRRVIGGETYENATRVAKPKELSTPHPPKLPPALGFPEVRDLSFEDRGYTVSDPLDQLPGFVLPDLGEAGIHPERFHVELVDPSSPAAPMIGRLRELARPEADAPERSNVEPARAESLADDLSEATAVLELSARARDRHVRAGHLSESDRNEMEADDSRLFYGPLPEILAGHGVTVERVEVPASGGSSSEPDQQRVLLRLGRRRERAVARATGDGRARGASRALL